MEIFEYDSQASPGGVPVLPPEVVFIGNQCNFSDSLIMATSQELGQITSAVATSHAEFRRIFHQTGMTPSMVVFDEPTLRALLQADGDALQDLKGMALGLAFSTHVFAAACYADNRLRLHLTSVFPLDVRLDVWLSIIKLIAHGGNYICPEVVKPRKVEVNAVNSSEDCSLTQRQRDVLHLVADGQSNKRIADMLGLSIHTVKLHLHNASLRLGARNRTEAAMRYRAMRS